MSRLSVNRTLIGLNRSEMMMLQVNRFTKRIEAKHQVAMPAYSDTFDWNAILPTFERLFSTSNLPQPKAMSIYLASDFVRYLILPPVNSVMRSGYKAAFAKAALMEVYGTQVNQWHIQYDDAKPGQPTLCAAIDQSLMAILRQYAQTKRIALNNVQPYLMSVFNRFNSQCSRASFYFSVVESNRLILVYLQEGRWHQIRNLPLEQDWLAQLSKVLQREHVLSELKSKPSLLVYAPQSNADSLKKLKGWQIKRVGLEAVNRQTKPYAMLEAVL